MLRTGWLALIVVLAGGVAVADDPADGADPGPADPVGIVGRYKTRLTWTGCSPPGARTAAVTVSAIDSRFELDLAAVRDGLGTVVVAGDRKALSGTLADVTVTLGRDARGATTLAIELTSGCRARGTARRDDTGIAACDELAALARIEVGCSAVAADARREDLPELDRNHAGWARLTGKRKRAAGDACQARVDAIRPALVDAACLAIPTEDAPTMIEECRDLAARIARLSQCRTLPAHTRTQLRDMLGQISVEAVHTDADSIYLARQICLRQDEVVRELAPHLGCQ